MKTVVRVFMCGMLLALLPSLGWTQSTDRSEMDQWVKASEKQGDLPVGTKITTSNWQQYKQFMPLGMIKLFEGQYQWKMPPDVELAVEQGTLEPGAKITNAERAGRPDFLRHLGGTLPEFP